jgi:hypothetical protein
VPRRFCWECDAKSYVRKHERVAYVYGQGRPLNTLGFKGAYLAGVIFHLLLVLTVSCRDTFVVLSKGNTIFPSNLDSSWREAESAATALIGQDLPKANPLRQGLSAYLNAAGIDAGYGFFAPHVPSEYKLVFELHYQDGRIEYETPSVNTSSARLHLVSLLDFIGQVEDGVVREGLIKFLVYAAWREHRDVSMIRAVFGTVDFPTAREFERGKRESYQVLYAYDVTFEPKPVPIHQP